MKTLLGGIAVLIVCIVGFWMVAYPRAIVNVRLTIEVDTPEGVKTGASVSQLGFSLEPAIGTRGYSWGLMKGEAVAVDLGPRGTLYALLTWPGKTGFPEGGSSEFPIVFMKLLAPALWRAAKDRAFIAGIRGVTGKTEIPPQMYPVMVRFGDEKVPQSVRAVAPSDLASAFGSGVTLKRVILETTTALVTDFISSQLSWVPRFYEMQLDGDKYETILAKNKLANSLTSGAFKAGSK